MSNIGLMGEYEKLSERLEKIDSIHEIVTRMDERQKKHDENISKLNGTVYGNGQEGIVTKLAKLEQKVAYITAGVSLVVSGTTAFIVEKIKGR